MVYYFTSNVVSPPGFIYVGEDKVESKAFIPSERPYFIDHVSQMKS